MRLKKGFTLAEILIVLMVIGVIATMTIPSMMKGVTEAQLKAGYKKAYNTISNFAAMERVAGALPSRSGDENLQLLYQALNNSLSVKSFAVTTTNDGIILQNSEEAYPTCMTVTVNGEENTMGFGTDCAEVTLGVADEGGAIDSEQVWIITEDNLAYAVFNGGKDEGENCATKQEIGSLANDEEAAAESCMVVLVDVNGLSKGPNTMEEQGVHGDLAELEATTSLETLTGDQYKIYLGLDGASPGPRATTATGRIMADLK